MGGVCQDKRNDTSMWSMQRDGMKSGRGGKVEKFDTVYGVIGLEHYSPTR